MRILLVADIHANWPALQVINEPHDVCVFLGDLVDYGLEPVPCIDWVRTRAKYAIRGNHDHDTAQQVTVTGTTGFRYLTAATVPLNRQQLRAIDLRYLADLPISEMVTLDNARYLFVHGTPRDPLDEYARPDVEYWTRRLADVDTDVVCVGHTHNPYVVEVGNTLVINPGSVGLPRDGDPRASYAVIDNGEVELKRIEYPVEETVQVIQKSALPDQAKEMLTEVYRSGGKYSKPNSEKKEQADGQPMTG